MRLYIFVTDVVILHLTYEFRPDVHALVRLMSIMCSIHCYVN